MALDVFSPVDGNTHVVEMLENRLKLAKEGAVSYGAVILVIGPADCQVCFAGLSGREMVANYAADLLKKELMDVTQKRMQAPVNPSAMANRWYYDLFRMPVSFDFSGALINAEMARVREGAPHPLRIGWYTGPNGDLKEAFNTPEREQYFYGILRPMIKLIGAIEDPTAVDGRNAADCAHRPVMEAHARGEPIPKFSAPQSHLGAIEDFLREACNGQAPVTITLREAKHAKHRNSNLVEWLKFGNWLKDQGENVIFVRDTAMAREPLEDQCTCYAASEDLMIRCALYQKSKASLFCSNGPCILAAYMDRPYLIFNQIEDNNWYRAGTTDGFERFMGFEAGGQFPWARNDQRIIWQPDRFEIIRDSWRAFIAPSLSRAASGYQLEDEQIEAAE